MALNIGAFFSGIGGAIKAAAPVVAVLNPAAGAAAIGAAGLIEHAPTVVSGVGRMFKANDSKTAFAVVAKHISRAAKSRGK